MDTRTLGHFIGGDWTGADGALESRNPSNTEDVVARFPNGGAAEVDQAVKAATARSTSAAPPSGTRATTSSVFDGLRLSSASAAPVPCPPMK